MESTTQVVGHKLIKERLKYMMPMIITINLKMYEVAIQIQISSRVQNKKYSSGKKMAIRNYQVTDIFIEFC